MAWLMTKARDQVCTGRNLVLSFEMFLKKIFLCLGERRATWTQNSMKMQSETTNTYSKWTNQAESIGKHGFKRNDLFVTMQEVN